MVFHQRERQQRHRLHQAAIEQSAHVVMLPTATGQLDVVVQRSIEEMHPSTRIGHIPGKGGQVAAPVLPYHEQALLPMLVQALDPVVEDIAAGVIDAIQAEAIHANGVEHPAAPVLPFTPHFWIVDVEIKAHQLVFVPLIQIYINSVSGDSLVEQPHTVAVTYIPKGSMN